MIIYKKIKLKNFLSFGNVFTEIELNSHKKNIITGKNGNGKSVILDGLCFVLFGKPFRHVKKINVINSINKKDCVVEIEFSVNNKEYKVVRGIKPAIFEIYQNGVLLNQDAATKDYQEYLETNIIGSNYKTFIQVVILGSARYVPFMSLSAADRRSVIEELLDIQIFSSMNLLIKDKLSNLKTELTDLTYKIDILKEKIKYEKSLIKNSKKQKEEIVHSKKKDVENYSTKIIDINDKIKNIESNIIDLTSKIIEKSNIETRRNKIIETESKAESNLSKLKKQIEFYNNNDNCPTCKQTINPEFKLTKIETAETKRNSIEEGLKRLSLEYDQVKTRLSDINEVSKQIQLEQSEIIKLKTTIETYENFIIQINNEINSLKENDDVSSEDGLNGALCEYDVLDQKYKTLVGDKKYLEYSATLLKDGGIKTKIIKQYLPVLNKLINYYLSKFEFFVNFNINEKFEEVIKSRHRDAYQYNSFSEGQKTKIDLSILLAFRELSKIKNSVSCNLLLLDEIIDSSLDNDSIELFLDLLDDLDYNTNIFVISPKADNLQDRFDRILGLDLVKNFSRIKIQ